MRLFYKIFIGFICITLFPPALQAQESPTVSGGVATGTSGSVSFSIGQVLYKSQTGTNGYSITEGVQQPYEISIVYGIPESSNLNISVYPNPTTNYLAIKTDNYKSPKLQFFVIDINGQILKEAKIRQNKTLIKTDNWVTGTYFIKITNNKNHIKTFKIIKNNF